MPNPLILTMGQISREHTEYIILGDFNVDLMGNDFKSKQWKRFFEVDYGYTQMIDQPTRINNNGGSRIDNIFF